MMDTPTGPAATGAAVAAEFNREEAASAARDSGWCDGHRMDGRSTAEDEERRAVRAKGFIERIR